MQRLSLEQHRGLHWRRPADYNFAARRQLIAIGASELQKAALALPLAFVFQQGQWALCALVGLMQGQNLFVAPDGKWSGTYIPASIRAHPFHLGWEGTEASLCIDENSGLLTLGGDSGGEPIFNSEDKLSESVQQVWLFLSATAQSVLALEKACTTLASVGVIEPWPLNIHSPNGVQAVEGLHRINEVALNNLDNETFGQVRRAGLAAIAYAQLISMGNMGQLGILAQAKINADAQREAERVSVPLVNLPNDSTIDWDWSKVGR